MEHGKRAASVLLLVAAQLVSLYVAVDAKREARAAREQAALSDRRRLLETSSPECTADDAFLQAFGSTQSDIAAFARAVKKGAGVSSSYRIEDPHLTRAARERGARCHSGATCAQLLYVQIWNALWDANVLPLPPQQNGRSLISRLRVDSTVDTIRRRMQAGLFQVPPGNSAGGCVEWDALNYVSKFFAKECRHSLHVLRYEPDPNAQRVIAAEVSATVPGCVIGGCLRPHKMWNVDLCAARLPAHIPRGAFKVVMATQVLEHLHQPFRCMSNLYELVATNGVVIVTAPFIYPYHGVPFDFFRYTTGGLSKVGIESGFDVLDSFGVGSQRESEASLANFWSSALPPAVYEQPAAKHYHTVAGVWAKGFVHANLSVGNGDGLVVDAQKLGSEKPVDILATFSRKSTAPLNIAGAAEGRPPFLFTHRWGWG